MSSLKNLLLLPAIITCLLFISLQSYAQTANSCWAISIDDNEPAITFTKKNTKASKAARTSDGFVLCGSFENATFPSKDGNTKRLRSTGPYVARYDSNGNLKWVDYGIDPFNTNGFNIHSITTDANDNIYICGVFSSHHYFYYNNGSDSIKIALTSPSAFGSNFVAKLDKDGKVLWHTGTSGLPQHINYDNNGAVLVTGEVTPNNHYIKGPDTSFTDNFPPLSNIMGRYVYWIDTLDGTLKKHILMCETFNNYVRPWHTATDLQGNLFISGTYTETFNIYAPGLVDSLGIKTPPTAGNIYTRSYTTKIAATGYPQWIVHDTNSIAGYSSPVPTSLSIANNGDVYTAAAYRGGLVPADSLTFMNADNTVETIRSYGRHGFLYAISKDGKLKWHTISATYTPSAATIINDTTILTFGYNFYTNNKPRLIDTFFAADKINYKICRNLNPNIGIASYDTAGNIIDARRIVNSNGANEDFGMDALATNTGAVLLYGDMMRNPNTFYGTDANVVFNDSFKTRNVDGFVIKYTPGVCDTVNATPPPPYIALDSSFADTVLCREDTFFLPLTLLDSFEANNRIGVWLEDPSTGVSFLADTAIMAADSIYCIVPFSTSTGPGHQIFIYTTNPPMVVQVKNPLVTVGHNQLVVPYIHYRPNPASKEGDTLRFGSSIVNGGSNPKYQWRINGIDVPGATGDSFITHTLKNNDTLSLVVTSSLYCTYPDSPISSIVIQLTTPTNNIAAHNRPIQWQMTPNPTTGVHHSG